MKVLYVIDYFKPHIGGVEKLYDSLSGELVRKGHPIVVVTWKYNKKLQRKEILNGVEIVRVWAPSRILFPIFSLPRIIKECRTADFIHTSTYSAAIGAWAAARICRKKVVVTVHEIWNKLGAKLPYLNYFEKTGFRLFEKFLLSLHFDQYIAVSDYTRNSLIECGILPDKIVRIYNGIEYNLPQWTNAGKPFTFTFFGRVGSSKGLDLFLDASEQMVDSHPEVRYKFIISPQSNRVFREVLNRIHFGKLIEHSIVRGNLSFEELKNELLSSNCIVIPSYSDGFGFAAVEVSAMNIPLISSGQGALPEVVSGKVIEMEHFDSRSLYLAMEKALTNEFSTIPARQFPLSEFIQHHEAIYKKIIEKVM
jgi:glycosyltransferase involved in cell wall biosynthesis